MGQNVEVKELDDQGRVAIPSKWRKKWKTRTVTLTWKAGRVEIQPVNPVKPSELFDSISVPAYVDFTNTHSLRKALLRSETE